MNPTDGTHSPFDTDACAEWAIYCQRHNHNPNTPLTKKEWLEFKKELDAGNQNQIIPNKDAK